MEGQTPTYTGAIRQIPTIHHMELVVYIFEHGIQFHTGRLVLQCSGAVIAFTCPKRFVPGPDTRGCAFSSDGSSGQFVVVWSLSCVRLFATPWMQHTRLPCPSRSPEVCSHSCPLSRWCHPAISPFVVPFSSCPQSFPASGSFPMIWLFTLGSQSIGVSTSVSVLTMNIQCWFPLGLTGLISLLDSLISLVGSLARHNEVLRKQIHATDLYKEAKLLIYCKKYDYQVHWTPAFH